MSISFPISSSPQPMAIHGGEEHIDWKDELDWSNESLSELSEEELFALLHKYISDKTGGESGFTENLYQYFMYALTRGAEERETLALLFMREVEANNIKLDEYNGVLALLHAHIDKDAGDVDLHSIMLSDGTSLHEWFLANEPEIYKGSVGDTFLTQDELNALVNSMQSRIETIGTNTQILMLQIQDEMGKSDTLTSGVKTVLDSLVQVLTTIIRGL